MSSKRFITASVNYVELFKRCSKNQVQNLRSVQAKNKPYIKTVESLSAEKKDINWEYYRANVRPGFLPMVEEFKKKYTEFEVPYPKDHYSELIEKLAEECEIFKYKAASDERIEGYERRICYILSQNKSNRNQVTFQQLLMSIRVQLIERTEMFRQKWLRKLRKMKKKVRKKQIDEQNSVETKRNKVENESNKDK